MSTSSEKLRGQTNLFTTVLVTRYDTITEESLRYQSSGIRMYNLNLNKLIMMIHSKKGGGKRIKKRAITAKIM